MNQSLRINFTSFGDKVKDLLDTISVIPIDEKRKKINLADNIFGYKLIFNPPNPKLQIRLWNYIMPLVWNWEDSHEKVHKGSAYYFMGEIYLSLGDIPSAYICFFNALEDDKTNFPHIPKMLKDAPAYRTTSLIDNPNNALFLTVVKPLRTKLQEHIDNYKTRTKSKMKLDILDLKFLQSDQLEDIKRFFVATFHEMFHLNPLYSSRMINNDYSKLKIIDTLFNLGLIIDQILEHRFLKTITEGRKNMATAVYQLALFMGWTTPKDTPSVPKFLGQVYPNLKGTPDTVIPHLIDGTATFKKIPMNNQMRVIFLAYYLRNLGGHNLKGINILIQRYEKIQESMMDSFFVSIEAL